MGEAAASPTPSKGVLVRRINATGMAIGLLLGVWLALIIWVAFE